MKIHSEILNLMERLNYNIFENNSEHVKFSKEGYNLTCIYITNDKIKITVMDGRLDSEFKYEDVLEAKMFLISRLVN